MPDYNSVVTLLGYFTLFVGAVVLGSAGLARITVWFSRFASEKKKCMWVDDGSYYCLTHQCGPYDDEQCGKVACPHCFYKHDPETGTFGYPAEGTDPHNPANYLAANECIREQGHDNPCNGFPRRTVATTFCYMRDFGQCALPECENPTLRPGQPCDPCHDELGAGA